MMNESLVFKDVKYHPKISHLYHLKFNKKNHDLFNQGRKTGCAGLEERKYMALEQDAFLWDFQR